MKGENYIEEMQNIRIIVFDKTGTLTEGKLEVTDVIPLNNYSKENVLQIADSIESKSKYPLAEAVLKHVDRSKMEFKNINNFYHWKRHKR